MTNPLFAPTPTPAFDRIKPEHFTPAFEQVFADIEQAYLALRDNGEPPTFENTAVPFDTLFAEYGRLSQVLDTFYSNIRSDEISGIVEKTSIAFDALAKKIYQDGTLGKRFKSVYDSRTTLALDDEDEWFLKNIYDSFEENGAFLDEEQQRELLRLDAELIAKAQKCYDNMMDSREQQAFLITDPALLSGVPADKVAAFAEQAQKAGKDGWLFVPERLLVDELLEVADNRDFRRNIHEAMNRVGTQDPYDNEALLKEVVALRARKAQMLGYKNYAEFRLADSMAGSVAQVEKIFDESMKHLLPRYESDMRTLESWAAQQPGGPQKLEPWDVSYFAAKYRKDVLGFDSAQLSRHLELENVLKGWLLHADKNMNLAFTPTTKFPVWDPEVRAFEVTDRDSGETSVLYVDPYARPETKVGGAWMSGIQDADKITGRFNAVVFNMNLSKPAPGGYAFLDKGQNETFYHEGGHGQHGLKGQMAKYRSHRGAGNESGYLEIHSTIEERVPYAPEVLPTYAFDPVTGKLPDPALMAAMEKADHFLATREVLKMLQNARRDLLLHATTPEDYTTAADIEQKADIHSPYSAHIRSYPLRRFDHLTGDGYAALYNGYFRANVGAAIIAEPYQRVGLYDSALLAKKREFYAIGAGLEPNLAFEKLTGRKTPDDIRPYMRSLGINIPKP